MGRALLCIAVAVTALAGAASSADARACGPGFSPAPGGRCVPMRPGPFPGRFRIGGFYPGHGWWDGRRFHAHRVRWRGVWRYF
jgi:hypothetical protein